MIFNYSTLTASEFEELARAVEQHAGLRDVLAWGAAATGNMHPRIVAEVVTQDEFTHDVIVPYRSVFIVYDTT